ncbi:MAG TPA: phosphoribosylformylglycinamidine synthase, partial [archaeon]|nr:phosphoribosylformylglycinamidine synthase [archaeon]
MIVCIPDIRITRKADVFDPVASSIKARVQKDLKLELDQVFYSQGFSIHANLSEEELVASQTLFYEGHTDRLLNDGEVPGGPEGHDFVIRIYWKPEVTDNTGQVSKEALQDLLGRKLAESDKVHTYSEIFVKGPGLDVSRVRKIAELYYNEMVQQVELLPRSEWSRFVMPEIPHVKTRAPAYIDLNVSDEDLLNISKVNSLALSLVELKAIQSYFNSPEVVRSRQAFGMKTRREGSHLYALPTDVELEVIAQTWSEHCKHKVFNALIRDARGNIFQDLVTEEAETSDQVDSIFRNYIKVPAMNLKRRMPWIKSILKDNAGVVDFDENWLYTLKWESHNSPSAKEPYGGAYTGIVGVYRDPMGTGRGGRIIAGFYAFNTGSPFYDGELNPSLHPKQLLEGVRRGVEAGGNCSGNPTVFGYIYPDDEFMGKPYIGVGASSLVPREIDGKPGFEKQLEPGYLAVVVGGRVGIDGIHGATESSLEGGKHISSSHVQMGNAYLQKKVQDFIIEATLAGRILAIQDMGAGGVSSAFNELAHSFNLSVALDLKRHLTKYDGLQPWQIMVSESQERMALAINPQDLKKLESLAEKHDVEMSVLGAFTKPMSGEGNKLEVVYGAGSEDYKCAYLDLSFLHDEVPQLKLDATWLTPEERGLAEPAMADSLNPGEMLTDLLKSERIASFNYIVRQFDHEVQGGSVVKPLVGRHMDVHSDASVIMPVLGSRKGIAYAAANNPQLGKIDTYQMTLYNFDEAIRRVIAVGGSMKQMPMNDNFGWPSVIPGDNNPDAGYKVAQLWRAARAVADGMEGYDAPCISGKDSMFMDGSVPLKRGGEKRVSAPPMVQMSSAGLIEDVTRCITMDSKQPGDLI